MLDVSAWSDTLTVADQLAYDALPADTRALCDRMVRARLQTVADAAYGEGYRLGETAGRRKQMSEITPPPKDRLPS